MSNIHLNQKKGGGGEKKRQQGKKKKKGRMSRRKGKKKKVKKINVRTKPMCKCTRAFLSIIQPHFLPLVFSLFWKENFLIGQEKKNLDSTIYFLFSPPN